MNLNVRKCDHIKQKDDYAVIHLVEVLSGVIPLIQSHCKLYSCLDKKLAGKNTEILSVSRYIYYYKGPSHRFLRGV